MARKHSPKRQAKKEQDNDELCEFASWSSNSTCTFNGEVLMMDGALAHGTNELFQQSHVALECGHIYGLVGPNGSGKTSLIRALPTLPGFPKNFHMEYLSPESTETSSSRMVHEQCRYRAEQRIHTIQQEIQQLESSLDGNDNDVERVSNELAERYEQQDDLTISSATRAERMLEALQFHDYRNTPFYLLSSGWKYRCELVSVLVTRPDCLCIDEPSFLDARSMDWFLTELRDMVRSWLHPPIVLFVSHKESLLKAVCDRILYLNPESKTLSVYHCSYEEFRTAHAERVAHARRAKEQATREDEHAKRSLDTLQKQLHKREQNLKATTSRNADQRFIKGKNKEAKQKADHSAASKVKRVRKKAAEACQQERLLRAHVVAPLALQGNQHSSPQQTLVTLDNMSFRHHNQDLSLLEWVDAQIRGTDKILLCGPNGSGKSTLVKLIVGALEPTEGEIRRRIHPENVAWFPQDALVELVQRFGDQNAVDFVMHDNINQTNARNHLGKFGLKGKLATRPIRMLSAGQRARLWLARAFLQNDSPSLLILDEATENLDKETTDSILASCAETFHAAVLAISHDEYFHQQFPATQVWTIQNNNLRTEYQ